MAKFKSKTKYLVTSTRANRQVPIGQKRYTVEKGSHPVDRAKRRKTGK